MTTVLRSRNNTEYKKVRYYAYYERMTQVLDQIWQPGVQRRVHSLWLSGRSPISKKLTTAVSFGLTANGDVKFVELIKSSGIDVVDDAAVQAFFEAETFPNPPELCVMKQRRFT